VDRKIIVHMGFHKTGSTYVQELLKLNAGRLPEGFVALHQASPHTARLRRACLSFQKARRAGPEAPEAKVQAETIVAECRAILERHAGDAHTVLISDEELAGYMPGRLGARAVYPCLAELCRLLREGFAPHPVQFVFYTREPEGWLKSVYNQAVKQHKVTKRYHRFRQDLIGSPDLAAHAAVIREEFGAEAVSVFSFEEERQIRDRPFGASLFALAGLPEALCRDFEIAGINRNESLHPIARELMRSLNETALTSEQIVTIKDVFLRREMLFSALGRALGDEAALARFCDGTACDVATLYYVNLDIRPERDAHMRAQLAACPWPVERMPGVMLNDDPEALGLQMQPSRSGERGVAGIWLAHRACLEKALETPREGAILLLEDDVRIAPNFWSERLILPTALPDDWEILLFNPKFKLDRKTFVNPMLDDPIRLRGFRHRPSGAHFCVFRDKDVLRKILARMDESRITDVDLFYINRFRTYGFPTGAVRAGGFASDHGGIG